MGLKEGFWQNWNLLIRRVAAVSTEHAFQMVRELGKTEGVLVGISSGAALWAAVQEAKCLENEGKSVVVLLPDTGERYLSTPVFEEE